MALDPLASLLSPYRSASSGAPLDFATDPIYSLLMPQQKQATNGPAVADAPAGGDVQEMARRMAAKRGWTGNEWDALYELVNRESGWNPQADNPTSTAYGLFQFLDSTRQNYGIGLGANPKQQIRAGLKYVNDRYGDPIGALNFHDSHNWY